MSQNPRPPSRKASRNCLVNITPPLKIPLCLDKRPMARAHKHGYLLLTCTVGGAAEGEPVLVFVVLRASAIEWFNDEVTARTAGSNLGELTLTSRSVVHEELHPSAPPRHGSPAVSGGGGATPLLRLVSGGRELQLEADSEPAMREWLDSIRARLSTLGADANNPKPPAPPRANQKRSEPPLAKQSLLPQGTPRSDDARVSQARWLFAQEAPMLSEDDPERGASLIKGQALNAAGDDQVASGVDYLTCVGGCQMRASYLVLLVWLLAAVALAEGVYICM